MLKNTTIGVVYCHGWGFDAQTFMPLAEGLHQRMNIHTHVHVDLGFTGSPHQPQLDAKLNWLAIGHSYGFAWLIQKNFPWCGIVGINAFRSFPASTTVDTMLIRLAAGEDATRCMLANFYERCGSHREVPAQLNRPALRDHLQALRNLDLPLPSYPWLAISAPDDKIIAPKFAQQNFNDVVWLSGGHCLPEVATQACAQRIHDWWHRQ